MTKLIIAIAALHHNLAGKYELSDEVDPRTGELKLRSIPVVIAPGEFARLPVQMADELIAAEAAREPSETELQVFAMQGGVSK
jgi:hypothetical protein